MCLACLQKEKKEAKGFFLVLYVPDNKDTHLKKIHNKGSNSPLTVFKKK